MNITDKVIAWKTEDLLSSNIIYELEAKDLSAITSLADCLLRSDLKITNQLESLFLDTQLANKLASAQKQLEETGICLFRGMPTEGQYDIAVLEKLYSFLASAVGVVMPQTAEGEYLGHIMDEGYKVGVGKARGTNTKEALFFHTDPCDIVSFFCLQSARSGGESLLVNSYTLYKEVLKQKPNYLLELCQPFCYKRFHTEDASGKLPYYSLPVFGESNGYFASNYLRLFIEWAQALKEVPRLTDQQIKALDFLDSLAMDSSIHAELALQPGDIIFINNYLVYHGRKDYEDFDEVSQKRHFLRLWLSSPVSRPLPASFAELHLNINPGEPRGMFLSRYLKDHERYLV